MVFMGIVGFYRSLTAGRPPKCRFIPSCSEYAVEATAQLGLRRALPLIARRLGRCRPGGGYGYDPVPSTDRGEDVHEGGLPA